MQLGRDAVQTHPARLGKALVAAIIRATDTIKPPGLQTAFLETGVRIRRGRDPCVPAFPAAPCCPGRRGPRARRESRSGNPRRRLLVRSKGVKAVDVLVPYLGHTASWHGGRRIYTSPGVCGSLPTFRSEVRSGHSVIRNSPKVAKLRILCSGWLDRGSARLAR